MIMSLCYLKEFVGAPTLLPDMPLIETEAIVLRTYRLGESDKIVSLLTRRMGRLRAVAKGAFSRRGRFGAALEPLSYIRLWVYDRENRDLQRIGSTEILESFFEMQKEYQLQVAAQYLAEVTERFLPERELNERVFRLLLAVLRAMKKFAEVNRPLLFFDYWLLRLGGFLPELSRCIACRRLLENEIGYYGTGYEGVACRACKMPGTPEEISANALNLVSAFRSVRIEQWIESGSVPPGTGELRRFFEQIIESHLERKLTTREMLGQEL